MSEKLLNQFLYGDGDGDGGYPRMEIVNAKVTKGELNIATSVENAEAGKFVDITARGPMSIKKQIEKLPDSKMAYLVLQSPLHKIEGGCNVADLKALADSHTRLLKEVKNFREQTRASTVDLDDAITEAEKL